MTNSIKSPDLFYCRLARFIGALIGAVTMAAAVSAQPVKVSGGLATGGDVSSAYAFSPDGRFAVFNGDKDTDGKHELYSVRLSTGVISNISGGVVTGGNVANFKISPDSARVVFRSDLVNDEVIELFSAPIAGGARATLSSSVVANGDVFDYQISPDGSRVLFRADKDTDEVFELYRVQVGGAALALDIDGDDRVLPLTDLLLLTRYQLGMRGSALIANALGENATITGATAIENRIRAALGVGLPF
jgi:dipeptidyl aminopeptidase/acylaminoacyl peptidase